MTIEIDGVNNTLKTDKIEPQSGTALQVGASGDTITLPSGATLNIAGTITNSGTATGFGALDWQTSDVKTSTFTAVAGKGYLVNTTGGAITVNLPAGSAGTQIGLVDYAGTWNTNACTIAPDGSEKIEGATQDVALENERESVTLLYQDSTQGWIAISNSDGKIVNPTYIAASGGTETTSGDYKIHTFNSTGTFTVSSVGNSAGGGDEVSYMVIAGGGGGGTNNPASSTGGGGGGAGGYREGKASGDPYTASPLNAPAGLTVTAQAYPITVGGGGAGTSDPGLNSVFSTITSAGGGNGASYNQGFPGANGGSGGGGAYARGNGTGNTPPVSPPQGTDGGYTGGASPGSFRAGMGGGGAGGVGGDVRVSTGGGLGGAGTTSNISGSPVGNSGGGGGGGGQFGDCAGGTASDGGGAGADNNTGSPGSGGTANTGGGGGGAGGQTASNGGAGGSGKVVIRYKYQN